MVIIILRPVRESISSASSKRATIQSTCSCVSFDAMCLPPPGTGRKPTRRPARLPVIVQATCLPKPTSCTPYTSNHNILGCREIGVKRTLHWPRSRQELYTTGSEHPFVGTTLGGCQELSVQLSVICSQPIQSLHPCPTLDQLWWWRGRSQLSHRKSGTEQE